MNFLTLTNFRRRDHDYRRFFWQLPLLFVAASLSVNAFAADTVANQTTERDHNDEDLPIASITAQEALTQFWELTPEAKRGTFRVSTFEPNFILPLHYTSSINNAPESPSRGALEPNDTYKTNEIKIQLSLRTKVLEDFLLPNADVWAAYTQVSLWQAYNAKDSRPFRSTNHRPEVFYLVPMEGLWDPLPGDFNLQFVTVGLAHESNGQSDPLSRSWNYTYASATVQWRNLIIANTWKQRINETGDDDDNPDLVRYRGNFELQVSWLPGRSTASIKRVSRELSMNRGSWQFDYTYPLTSQADGLRLYLQMFSGYGESLVDYNHRQNRIGIGFLLLNF
ncbi:MAG: phospholipase A [Gammaproteobacteria bacterium]|nr:phospholipase A [Gammaproteobacteria bacterium]